ncbi:MAG: DUF1517 domain-containing protein [Sandaracinaceae bacterium]|nr:DUF1517 domain-containing protein [Sandaracinaceae bacterium]
MNDEGLMDVAVVELAVSDAARPAIQAAMDAIASRGDTSSPAGLVAMLREAIGVLRVHGGAWTHAAAENASPMAPAAAEARFVAAADRARARFDVEVVRNFRGVLERRDPPPLAPSEAPGLVVITLIVAARRALRDAEEPTRAAIEAVLADLEGLASADLVALDVVWSPADPADRMSAEAMHERYPELFALSAAP